MNDNTRGWLATIIAFALGALFLFLFALNASAQGQPDEGPDTITVDGITYDVTQKSGPVSHFETPNTNPNSASTDRNTWTGNGSEHLPCPGGIHWIDNTELLTISNCLEESGTTTTTSTQPTTTTTVKETTTTNGEESTTTTKPQETTTSAPSSSTTNPSPTTTEAPSTSATLPYTGIDDPLALGVLGLLLGSTGGLILAATRKGNDEEDI